VEQVLGQEEEIALKEFQKFEGKLWKANASGGWLRKNALPAKLLEPLYLLLG